MNGLSQRLTSYLKDNEKILWSGKPVKTPFMFWGLVSIPFGIIFIAISIFWIFMTPVSAAPFAMFSTIFLLIGLGIAFGPMLHRLLAYRNTEYVITDQRVITQTGAIGLDTRFVDFEKIQEVYVTIGVVDRIFGTGGIRVVTAAGWIGRPMRWGPYGGISPMRPTLEALRNSYEVQKILQEAISKIRKNMESPI